MPLTFATSCNSLLQSEVKACVSTNKLLGLAWDQDFACWHDSHRAFHVLTCVLSQIIFHIVLLCKYRVMATGHVM